MRLRIVECIQAFEASLSEYIHCRVGRGGRHLPLLSGGSVSTSLAYLLLRRGVTTALPSALDLSLICYSCLSYVLASFSVFCFAAAAAAPAALYDNVLL